MCLAAVLCRAAVARRGRCTIRNNSAAATPCSRSATIELGPGNHRAPSIFALYPSLNCGELLTNLRVLSTHLFLNHRLHPGLLEFATRSGAEAVEIFAARQHFD